MKTDPDTGSDVRYGAGDASPSRGRMGALLAAAGVGVALIGGGIIANSDDESIPRMEVSAGTNLAITDDNDGLTAFNSPALVASPTEEDTLVVASRVDRPQLGTTIRRSTDGGASWSATTLGLPAGEVRAYAPDLAFDSQGTLWAAFATMSDPANNPTGIWVARSTDAGASFGAPSRVAGPYAYQPRVLANGSTVHVSFVQATNAVEGIKNGFGPPPNPVMVATSNDNGASFGTPVEVSGDRQRVGAATPFFGLDGDLLVLFEDFGDDAVDLEGQSGPVHDGEFALVLARSEDNGATFEEASVVDDAVKAGDRFNPYVPAYPSVAVAPRGAAPRGDAMYVAWADGSNGDLDVFVRRSNDDGITWGPRVQVGPATNGSGTDQYLPTVAVAQNGRVDIAFFDRSADPNNVQTAASLATSFDAGENWEAIAVSDVLFSAKVGPEGITPGSADLGNRLGVVSRLDGAFEVWTDTREGTEETARQDLFSAPVRMQPEQK